MKRFVIIVAVLFMLVTLGFAAQRVVPVTNAPVQTQTQGPVLQTISPQQLAQITILSPAGGEWKRGTTMPITFTISTTTREWVNILVKKGADTFYSFPHIAAASNPAKTTFNWTIPNDAIFGENYTVEVVSENNTVIRKTSNPFAIINPNPNVSAIGGTGGIRTVDKPNMNVKFVKNINITSPTAGDRWVIPNDKSITVQWDNPSYPKVNTVNIKLLRGDGTVLKPLAASIPCKTGSFNWKPTGNDIKPGEYRIQLTDTTSIDMQGTSEPFFFDAPTIAFTSPVADDTLIRGKQYDFSWTYNCSDKQTIKIMDKGVVLAENVPINAGNIGSGKGKLNLAIPSAPSGVEKRTIHLRMTGSSIDSASVPVNVANPTFSLSPWDSGTITLPLNSYTPYFNIKVDWLYDGNPNDIVTILIDSAQPTKEVEKVKAGAGYYYYGGFSKDLPSMVPFQIRACTIYNCDHTGNVNAQ